MNFFIGLIVFVNSSAPSAGRWAPSKDERYHKEDEEDEEQDFGDRGRCACHTAKAEDGRDNGDDEKCDSVS